MSPASIMARYRAISTKVSKALQVTLLPAPLVELDRDCGFNSSRTNADPYSLLRNIALHRRVFDTIIAKICYIDSLSVIQGTDTSASILSIKLSDYKVGSRETNEKRHELYRAYANVKKPFVKLESDLDQYLEDYVQASCRALCDDIQRNLPQKLRDYIHKRIIDDQKYFSFRDSSKCLKLAETEAGRNEPVKSWFFDGCDHLCDTSYISLNTMRDFVETRYCVVNFDPVLCLFIESVPKFFKHDLWGFDLPVHKHVRIFEVNGWEAGRSKNLDVLQCPLSLKRKAHITFGFSIALSPRLNTEANK